MVTGHEAIWQGTEQEAAELLAILKENCACQFNTSGARTSTCAGHAALVHDQRFINALVFYRRIAERLEFEEGLDCL